MPATTTLESVEVVSNLDALSAIEADWKSVHRADPESTVFTSWAWLWGRLSALPEPWCALVARAGARGEVVVLLPLRFHLSADKEKEGGVRTLAMAGSPLADYTGFLCAPGFEDAVLAGFAAYVRDRLEWRRLEIRDTIDSRLDAFLGHFPESRFRTTRHPPTPCPYLELDDSWECYLSGRVGPVMRQTIRRKLRAIDRLPGLRRTTVADDGERQISVLLRLWQARWGELPEPQLAQYRSVFRSCLRSGCLWLDILWDQNVPITGLLAFLDRERGSFCFYISGFNSCYAALSPGTVIVAHSIREAIRGGYRIYDFLRGDDSYKLSFGARARTSENVVILRAREEPTARS